LQSLAYPIGTPMKREAVDNTDSKSDVSSYCREPLRKRLQSKVNIFYSRRFCLLAIIKVRKKNNAKFLFTFESFFHFL
jgi:hypothetical protein